MKIAKKAAAVLCAGLMLISPGVISQPAYGEFPSTLTVNAAAEEHDISQGDITITDSGEHIIRGESTTHKITIKGGTPTVTVENVNITLEQGCPLTVNSDNFTLIVKGVNTFKSGNCAGIDVAGGNQITIKEDEDVKGTLNATGGNMCSGIGGGGWGSGGTIIIESGTINAKGGSYGAGIGGGQYANGGDVIVKGGTVTATGGTEGAGIGSGSRGGNGGKFTISGGTVTANGGEDAAGIGGGYKVSGGTVLVDGGTVNANGGESGAGIGGGNIAEGGDFTINGGKVTAKAGSDNIASDIGYGGSGGNPGTATYNGGTVNGVNYSLSYTFIISPTVKLGGSIDLKLSDVNIGDDEEIKVKLTKGSGKNNSLALSSDGEEIPYAIRKNDETGNDVNVGDIVLTTKGDGSVSLYFTEPTTTPKYTGNYTGTVTFSVEVNGANRG